MGSMLCQLLISASRCSLSAPAAPICEASAWTRSPISEKRDSIRCRTAAAERWRSSSVATAGGRCCDVVWADSSRRWRRAVRDLLRRCDWLFELNTLFFQSCDVGLPGTDDAFLLSPFGRQSTEFEVVRRRGVRRHGSSLNRVAAACGERSSPDARLRVFRRPGGRAGTEFLISRPKVRTRISSSRSARSRSSICAEPRAIHAS